MQKRRGSRATPAVLGDASPHPRPGPVTALRVLGQGFAVALPDRVEFTIGRARPPTADVHLPLPSISRVHAFATQTPNGLLLSDLGSRNGLASADPWDRGAYRRCGRTVVHVGGRFALGDVELLALDAATEQLTAPFMAYCGDECEDVDRALEGAARGHTMLLDGARDADLSALARVMHDHSVRRDFPFTVVETVPSSPEGVERLCAAAGSGTIYLDLRGRQSVPEQLARYLFAPDCHLRAVLVAQSPQEVIERFGAAFQDRPRTRQVCAVGFRRGAGRDDVDFFS